MLIQEYGRTSPSVPGMIHERMRSRPNAIAISAGLRQLTYGQLGTLTNKVRRRLQSAGVRKSDIVAVCMAPSPEFIAAALAIISAGAAYLPVDQNDPAERLLYMMADSGARVLITTSQLCRAIHVPGSVRVIDIDRNQEGEEDAGTLPVAADADPDDLAYLIYTSGSTGHPKGVEITHRGLSNLIDWHNRAFDISHKDRGSQVAGLSFDAAVWEIWPYLVSGATLCIPENCDRRDPLRLKEWLVEERITVAFVPTVLAEQLAQMTWPRKTALRLLLTGGEALRAYPRKGLPFTLVNNYGPTECTVVTTSGPIPGDGDCSSVPAIGRPIADAEIYILGEDLKRLEPGQTGEICIGGPSLARGYHNRPELTAEKFIPNPFDTAPGARLFRTGDLAKIREDGQIQFLGRLDDQVKIRGFRIEPNEIAVAISRIPAVGQCVVVARGGDSAEKQLIAYIVPRGAVAISQSEIREVLGKTVPDYMIPSGFVCLDELPLNANGKIDRAALPPPSRTNAPGLDAPVLPRTALERQIAAIVRNLLKLDEIGVEDNFFLLGGHSLLGAQLIGRLRERFNVEVPLLALFESPTVASLAAQIGRFVSEQTATVARR